MNQTFLKSLAGLICTDFIAETLIIGPKLNFKLFNLYNLRHLGKHALKLGGKTNIKTHYLSVLMVYSESV